MNRRDALFAASVYGNSNLHSPQLLTSTLRTLRLRSPRFFTHVCDDDPDGMDVTKRVASAALPWHGFCD